jgi:hypothetical protein
LIVSIVESAQEGRVCSAAINDRGGSVKGRICSVAERDGSRRLQRLGVGVAGASLASFCQADFEPKDRLLENEERSRRGKEEEREGERREERERERERYMGAFKRTRASRDRNSLTCASLLLQIKMFQTLRRQPLGATKAKVLRLLISRKSNKLIVGQLGKSRKLSREAACFVKLHDFYTLSRTEGCKCCIELHLPLSMSLRCMPRP